MSRFFLGLAAGLIVAYTALTLYGRIPHADRAQSYPPPHPFDDWFHGEAVTVHSARPGYDDSVASPSQARTLAQYIASGYFADNGGRA